MTHLCANTPIMLRANSDRESSSELKNDASGLQ